MLERLGEDELASQIEGDGAGSLVEAWASADPDGRVAIAVWNGTLDASKAAGVRALGRSVTLSVEELRSGMTSFGITGVHARHSSTSSGPGSASAGPTGRTTPAGCVSAKPTPSRPSGSSAASVPTGAAWSWSSTCQCPPCRSSSSCRLASGATVSREPDRRPPITSELRNRAGLTIQLSENGLRLRDPPRQHPRQPGARKPRRGRPRQHLPSAAIARRDLVLPVARAGCPEPLSVIGCRRGLGRIGGRPRLHLHAAPRLATADLVLTIRIANTTSRRLSLDAVLAQDLGIAGEAAVRSNELYTTSTSITRSSRTRTSSSASARGRTCRRTARSLLMHGCLDRAVGYLTDGFQLYGLSYKATHVRPPSPTEIAEPERPA